jgi:hypothetical protein
MRVFAAMLLGVSLAATPLMANNAGETGKEEASAAVTSVSTAPDKPGPTVRPERTAIESEVQDLRSLVEEQRAELEAQRAALKAEQLKMEALEEKVGVRSSEPATTPEPTAAISSAPSTEVVSATPASAAVSAGAGTPGQQNMEDAPLQLRIGSAYIIPIGFMDFTTVYRNHDLGSGIGTNFGNINIGNVYQNHLSEWRQSMQNSRIGFRIDASVMGAHVMGYMESDYLGNNAGSVAVTSNSNTLRSRLYWVDVRKDKWEVLGGQSWSLITPGRSGISPLPANIFFSQNIDVNYQLGLTWGRIPELRFVYHPSDKVAFAIALDQQEQYVGGSGGGPNPTFPTALAGLSGTQLNNASNTFGTPNVAPDVILKLAFDPSSKFHAEIGGVERQFKIWNPNTNATFSNTGAGGFLNVNFELFKGFRIVTNNYWSDGGGRYIFGVVPDLILRADGSISPIHTGSTVSGFEYTHKKTLLYAYYGGVYVSRNVTTDANGTTLIGYGYATASGGSQNRMLQEETVGFNQTVWRDPKWGAINIMGQYSYEARNPWSIVGAGAKEAHVNQIYGNLRYTLPGSAPSIK